MEQAIAAAEQGASADQVARLPELHERMHAIGGYAAPARAARLLHGLGFAPAQHDLSAGELSGGWRMRVNLARALMCRADLLLLDEPTNHLDLDAVLWLQDHLTASGTTLLVISHDRAFMDAVCTRVLHLEQRRARLYSGNYSEFERRRAEQLAGQAAQYAAQQKRLAHLESFVTRFRAKATKARQAQSRLKQIERMQLVGPAHLDSPFEFAFAEPQRLPAELLRLDRAGVGYEGRAVLQGLRVDLAPGDRIGLLGRNGAGKSTLVRLLAGELEPLAGQRLASPHLAVGYFAQHQLEQLDPAASPLEHLRRLDARAPEQALRDFLGGFDFRGERALEAVAPFSGGEKARLALALVAWRRPNLLLLDEPTNHLDLDMRHAIELALQDYPGAVVLVSHDRHPLETTVDTFWHIGQGTCQPFDDDLDAYARWLRSAASDELAVDDTRDDGAGAPTARQQRQHAARQRARTQPLRSALRKAEQQLERLQRDLAQVESRLADPELYSGDGQAIADLGRQRADLSARIEEAEGEWLSAAEALEQAQG